jgi:aerotaxis receptor
MQTIVPIDEKFIYEDGVIISQTDTHGIITYANRKFCEVSAYKRDELLGKPHSIIRHPDMPKEAFAKMWSTISGGQAWNGLVKNLRKDGLYYWVDSEILPILDDDGNITGYIAARKQASEKDIKETEDVYKKMLELEGRE